MFSITGLDFGHRNAKNLSSRAATFQNAYRTGQKDARVQNNRDPSVYGARMGSAWADWYLMGFDGLAIPQEYLDMGVTP